MNHIEKLIEELCPNGVEFKKLGEFATLDRGNGMPKTMLVDSGVGAIHYGQIYTHYGVSADKTLSFVTNDDASRLTKVHPGDVIITNTSENLEDVATTVVWLGDDDIVIGGHSSVIRHDQDARFIAYWFRSAAFEKQKYRLATGAKVIDISAKKLESVVVPVPPLEVQREIVKVLDLFTDLEAELEAELVARRKQYEHYRDQLLTFPEDGETPWVNMGDLVEIGTGSMNTNDSVDGGPYPFFVRSQLPRRSDCWQFDETAIITAGDGVGVGKVFHFVEGKYALHQRAYRICVKDKRLNAKFLFHFIRSRFSDYLAKASVHASVTSLRMRMFQRFLVPLPPLSEQKRIAEILDTFDALVNDLESGLPAEIEARRKQYEYYRDKLLTFKQLEPAA